jgi:glyceraldehyde-3-phosphate dehydrogenase type I
MRVFINGFGRIGRMGMRIGHDVREFDFVGINDATYFDQLVHLCHYDTTYGKFHGVLEYEGPKDDPTKGILTLGRHSLKPVTERDPDKLPLRDLNVDIVLDCTGVFKKREQAEMYLKAGAKKVIQSFPGKDTDITIVYGINHKNYDPKKHHIISASSCTTNCLAPIVKILDENFKILNGLMVTVHAYTPSQKLLDHYHKKDWRRARSAAENVIPTSSGAAKQIGIVFPHLSGKLNGYAMRIPSPTVSIVDFVAHVEKAPSKIEDVNALFAKAAENELKDVMGYTELPLVSRDYFGCPLSSVVDGPLTDIKGNLIRIVAWYDNEWGYCCRLIDLTKYVSKLGI